MPQMDAIDWIIFFISTVGVISFAVSGSIAAMNKKTDPFGTVVIAVTTTFGGGIIRDFLIGKIFPSFFTDWDCHLWTLLIVLTSFICMLVGKYNASAKRMIHLSSGQILNVFDAVGLAIFCVVGIDSVVAFKPELGSVTYTNVFILTFMGTVTGVGGGILRDLFTGQIPMIFRKHIYALPTIVGSLGYVFLLKIISHLPAMLIAISFIAVIRILAAKYHWNLPIVYDKVEELSKADYDERKTEELQLREKKLVKSKEKREREDQ